MWKPFDKHVTHYPGRSADRPPTARPAELFLDFDPVMPGWPPAGPDAPPPAPRERRPERPAGAMITIDDFRRLKAMLRDARLRRRLGAAINALARKLRQARIVLPTDVAADVVTMNSTVRVFDAVTGAHAPLTIVYPLTGGRDRGAVSVLSAIGTAILGHRAGERVGPRTGGGAPRFAIERVLYQPEAAGDLHL